MGRRKKSVPQFEAWCWYCDREFEDEKVLLQHQRAKHYRCPYCPRRLNTSGGLTVHLHQVHKAEPTTIDNALPGRESFDIEIYGMVGIPEADLAEWQDRKAKRGENGAQGRFGNGGTGIQRPKIDKGVISKEQLRIQLEAHKALMSGKAPPPGTAQALFGFAPPPAIGFPPNVPPPGFNPSIPPPPLMSQRPPPPFSGPPPPHGQGIPPYGGPPPGYPYPPPTNIPPPSMQPAQSYPAVQADAIPPSANSQNDTSEALAAVNEKVSQPLHGVKREADMEYMQSQANAKRARPSDEGDGSGNTNTPPSRPGRARAADLF